MITTLDLIFYIVVFLAIYVQVFFLVTFFERRKKLKFSSSDVVLSETPSITFLVPCYNEESSVRNTVKSVLDLDYPKDKLKIIIIDDGSNDSTWQKMQKFANNKRITLIKKENGGKHTALNKALEIVDTQLVASFDADTRIKQDALKEAVSSFIKDKDLMALGGSVLINSPKSIVQAAQSIEYQMFSFSKKMLGLLGGVLVVPGAFSVFRKEAFELVGGYKEAHKLEDLELTFRMQKAGLKVGHCHTAFVYTDGPESAKALFKQRLRWSYGFINNTLDYRKMIFNKKFGNFGMFTLPMTLLAYILILQVFFVTWYYIIRYFVEKITEYSLTGMSAINLNFDWFFVDTKATVFLSLIMYGSILLTVYLGGKMSQIKGLSVKSLFWFVVLYSVLVPFWIIKAMYNSLFIKNVSWR